MRQHTILKFLYIILSINLLILLTVVSCDENNNIFDGGGADNGDEMPDGDDGGPNPTPTLTMKPVLNFTGMGIDYDPEARCSTNNWTTSLLPALPRAKHWIIAPLCARAVMTVI